MAAYMGKSVVGRVGLFWQQKQKNKKQKERVSEGVNEIDYGYIRFSHGET